MTVVWALAGALLVAVVMFRFRRGSVANELDRARRSRDVAPVVAHLEGLRPSTQPDAYNGAIRRLWDDYERDLAAMLIRALAQRHADSRIAQYWLDQLQRVEPEIAAQSLDDEFLAEHFRADVAASCGAFG